ncbi:ComEC/Rec2 family competence protein [Streptomyces avicenniae]|uniref:ComEC/Rec2 family competence protein n=1 Tax=Streptomyces avicenniae TaxID=500153 RepID=UPI0006993FF8|nr:ComEC/Rec2 family competence protein [Streptomyces avicenniae]
MSRSDRPRSDRAARGRPTARHPVHAGARHRLGAARPDQRLPTDLRLVPPAVATWAAAALALGLPGRTAGLCALGCCLAAGATLCCLSARFLPRLRATARPLAVPVATSLLCAAAALAVTGLHTAGLHHGLWNALAGSATVAEATLTDDPRTARGSSARPGAPRPVLITADVHHLTPRGQPGLALHAPALLVVTTDQPDDWLALRPGTRLRLRAEPTPPLPGRSGELAAVLRVDGHDPPEVTADPGPARRLADRLREGLRDATAPLPGDAGTLLPALVIGDDSRVGDDLADAVRATGMTHLVVASGSQVAIVLTVLLGGLATAARAERGGIAARFGLSLRTGAVLGGVLVAGLVLVCRPDPSVLRAAACAGIALLALATGRHRALLPALAATVLILLLHDPTLGRSFGFLLSALATGALLTLAPRWSAALERRGMPRRPADALAAAAAAQLVCAPVVTVFTSGTSLVAIPCNLLAHLAVAPVAVLGWAALATAPVAPPVAEALAWAAGWPARWIATVARTGAALPGAETDWPGGWTGAALLAAVSAAAVVLLGRLPRGPWPVLLCVLVLLLAVLRPAPLSRLLTGWPPTGWRMVACDVGQGDALVLAAGPGSAVVVDAGPEPAAVDRCLRDLGVRHVPLLVVSHFHADHVAGLPGVLRGRSVEAVRVPSVGGSDDQAAQARRLAAEAGIPVEAAVPGDRQRVGSELSWEVLWPPVGAAGLGANDASVTLLVRAGDLTVLLPGDLEPLAQERLLAAHPDLPRADVLKVAHHGSAHQHGPLLDRLRPRLALVSCGEDNGYGHPAPLTLRRLADLGTVTLRTDLHGDLAVTAGPSGPVGVTREAAP